MSRPWLNKPGFRGGRGLRLKPGEMNATEAEYARDVLEPAKLAGSVLDFWFEGVTFRMAQDVRYTPDFLVLAADQTFEVHEVKGSTSKKVKCQECGGSGFGGYAGSCGTCKGKGKVITGTHAYLEPQDRIRLRVFADKFPIRARAVWKRRKYEHDDDGAWGSEDFTAWENAPTPSSGGANV